MDQFKLQDLIIGIGTDQGMMLKSHIQLCNRSQMIVCLDEAPREDLERLRKELHRILKLVDQREGELTHAVRGSA